MKVRFFLRHGAVVDWPVPAEQVETFELGALVQAVRSAGYFATSDAYINGADICVIGLDRGAGSIMPTVPETRQ